MPAAKAVKKKHRQRPARAVPGDAETAEPSRADARRNRVRVVEVALSLFASRGAAVPIHEIARRAGVGTGTVSRHFPTKASLFKAIVLNRVEELVHQAGTLEATHDPGTAFFEFFALVVQEGVTNRGVAEALAGAGFDVLATASSGDHDVMGTWGRLLMRAQRARAVRKDVDLADVKALVSGCLARERKGVDLAARARMIALARDGLRAPGQRASRVRRSDV
jgi:AcrR family transcriptional regulator